MSAERTDKALTRIDLALRRIAVASAQAGRLLDDRSRRNARLHQAIGDTLRELDQLISEQGEP